MKAVTWQRWISLGAGVMAFAVLCHPAFASAPLPAPARQAAPGALDRGLPTGLPGLPSSGETMQRSLSLGLALNGFDPVTYRLGQPVAGIATHELVLDGVVWRFASAANLAAFSDAPEIYAPAFGGFDPVGVAAGVAVDTDPTQFTVVGSHLFLFRTAGNRERFLKDGTVLSAAQGQWAAVERTVAR